MKKFATSLLAVLTTFACLAACGGGSDDSSAAESSSAPVESSSSSGTEFTPNFSNEQYVSVFGKTLGLINPEFLFDGDEYAAAPCAKVEADINTHNELYSFAFTTHFIASLFADSTFVLENKALSFDISSAATQENYTVTFFASYDELGGKVYADILLDGTFKGSPALEYFRYAIDYNADIDTVESFAIGWVSGGMLKTELTYMQSQLFILDENMGDIENITADSRYTAMALAEFNTFVAKGVTTVANDYSELYVNSWNSLFGDMQ